MRYTLVAVMLGWLLPVSPGVLLGAPTTPTVPGKVPVAETTFAQVNELLGVELFTDDKLWNDEASVLADRLRWPLESKTESELSFRSYPDDAARLFGCRPFSVALYADKNGPSLLSLIFANKGDSVSYVPKAGKPDKEALAARDGQIKDFKKAIADDKKNLTTALTKLFGAPVAERMGQGKQTSEVSTRWDWKEHAFLLSAPRDEYVALRVMPSATADLGGKSRISDSELMARSKTRILRRENGDVLLKDIPMVNQGPKGYCAPATWERALRYMGVPADMYVLAMAGHSGAGGGTSLTALAAGAHDAVVAGGRKIEGGSMAKVDPTFVAKYVDRGLPIIWGMFSTKEYNALANERMKLRVDMKDPKAWKKEITPARKDAKPLKVDRATAHACMIIGYNKETGEIAVSDSWGPEFEERWVTAAEATAVSQGVFQVVSY
jgi:hypothetical protein